MGLLEGYETHEARWRPKSATSGRYGDKQTGEAKTIKGRFIEKRRRRWINGEQILTEGLFLTEELVDAGDTLEIDGRIYTVKDVEKAPDGEGSEVFRQVIL